METAQPYQPTDADIMIRDAFLELFWGRVNEVVDVEYAELKQSA